MSNILELQAETNGTTTVNLSWLLGTYDDDGDGNPVFVIQAAPSFRVKRATNIEMDENVHIVETGTADLEYSDNTAHAGQTYFYQISEADEFGDFTAGYSDVVEITVNSHGVLVTITTITIPNVWQFGGTQCLVRFFANNEFYSDGIPVPEGRSEKWFREYVCTISGKNVTIPQVQLPSTTDSDVSGATYSAVFYALDKRTKRGDFLVSETGEFRIPPNPNTTTWEIIRQFNRSTVDAPYEPDWRDELAIFVESYFESVVSTVADEVDPGTIILTKPAENPAQPKVPGANESFYLDRIKYLRDYTETHFGIGAAVAAAETEAATFGRIDIGIAADSTLVDADLEVSSAIKFRQINGGKFVTTTGKELVLNHAPDATAQIFTGDGNAYVKAAEVRHEWWLQPNGVDITRDLQQMRDSILRNNGGTMILCQGDFTSDAIDFPSAIGNVRITGRGNAYDRDRPDGIGQNMFGTRIELNKRSKAFIQNRRLVAQHYI